MQLRTLGSELGESGGQGSVLNHATWRISHTLGQEIPEAVGQLPPLLAPLADHSLLIPVGKMTEAEDV